MDPHISDPEDDERGRLDNADDQDNKPANDSSDPRGPGSDNVYDYGPTEPSPTPGKSRFSRLRHPFGGGSKKEDGKEEETAGSDKPAGDDEQKSLYRQTAKDEAPRQWRLDRQLLGSRRRKIFFTLGLSVAGVTIFGIIGFLGVFKLDFLMNNIDQHTFARMTGTIDARNSRYVQTYFQLRLADIGDHVSNIDSDNLIFRSDKVRTGNPLHDWYRTMRTSSFEKDLLNKDGIKFVSIAYRENGIIKFRPAQITVKGTLYEGDLIQNTLANDIRTAINTGDPKAWLKVNESDWVGKYLDIKEFESNNDAQRAYKKAIKENTYFFQVFKRHFTRKAIANMNGTKSWRFFDKTRTKAAEGRVAMRNRLIAATLPDSSRTGQFINCLFGISDCKFSKDTASPANKATGTLRGSETVDPNVSSESTYSGTDADGKTVTGVVDYGPAAQIIKEIVSKVTSAINITNFVSLIDSVARIDTAMNNHKLSEGVSLARTRQAVALYQVFETARDQIKSGQVDGAEVNSFMSDLGPITNNEAFYTVVQGKAPPATTPSGQSAFGLFGSAMAATASINRDSYCSAAHQKLINDNPSIGDREFGYRCPDKQIGSNDNNATAIENGWNNMLGPVLHPIIREYNKIRHSFVGPIIDFAERVVGGVTSAIINTAISGLGLGGTLQSLGLYIAEQVSGFLGVTSMIHCPDIAHCGQSPVADKINISVQGAAAAQEATVRNRGGSLTTAASATTAKHNLSVFEQNSRSSQSLFTKLLSVNNPDSPAAKAAFGFSNLFSGGVGSRLSFSSIAHGLTTGFGSLFGGHPALAATSDAYAGATFAGIDSYDLPQQCFDLDPLNMQPIDGTNVLQVFSQFGIPVDATSQAAFSDWETVTNSDTFYQTVYDILDSSDYAKNGGNTDTVAQQIYNCNLLDSSVRDGLGGAYGYNAADALQ